MTDYLRFLLTPTDRDRIDVGSIQITETPFDPPPVNASDRLPESLRIQFTITNPALGAPQLRMLFPGAMLFLPHPVGPAPDIIPALNDVQLDTNFKVTAAQFATWSNTGILRVHATTRQIVDDLQQDNKIAAIGEAPLLAWFDPIELTMDFLNDGILFDGILHSIERTSIGQPPPQIPLPGTDINWPRNAVAGFYQSTFEPLLHLHAPAPGDAIDRNLDDVIRFPMPRLIMDPATGQVDLTITLAHRRTPSERAIFPGTNPHNVNLNHPGHPDYDVVPTRHFMQESRTDLIGADAGNGVADAIIGTNNFVTNTKANLTLLGFGNLGAANNTISKRVRWAIREFQIYSKMDNVASETPSALEYALRLSQHVNDLKYLGPINGHLNTQTRIRIAFWLNAANNYRCPVVVTARSGGGHQNVLAGSDNIWEYDEETSGAARMFVRDISGYYTLPAAPAEDITVGGHRFIIVGDYSPGRPTVAADLGGPRMRVANDHSWQTMILDGVRLTGFDETTMHTTPAHAAMWSTYLTVLPTVQNESGSRFDVHNSWDSETISVPFFHYTLNSKELGGFLSFMKYHQPGDFDSAIEFFGMKPALVWPNPTLLQAKRTSDLQIIQAPGVTYTNLPNNQDDKDYFKSWHWFYRFIMAARIFDNWKQTAYDFALQRLVDIRATPMTNRPAGHGAVVPQNAAGNNVDIEQVFTSEVSNAMLLRWHVKRPRHINRFGQADVRLWNALLHAQTPGDNGGINVNWSQDVNTWSNDHERALIAGLVAEAGGIFTGTTFNDIRNFARDGQTVSELRGSFQFDAP